MAQCTGSSHYCRQRAPTWFWGWTNSKQNFDILLNVVPIVTIPEFGVFDETRDFGQYTGLWNKTHFFFCKLGAYTCPRVELTTSLFSKV